MQVETLIRTEPQFKDLCHSLQRRNAILLVAAGTRAPCPHVLYSTLLIIHPLKETKRKLLYTALYLVAVLCLLHYFLLIQIYLLIRNSGNLFMSKYICPCA